MHFINQEILKEGEILLIIELLSRRYSMEKYSSAEILTNMMNCHSNSRNIRSLSLEGCSLLTTEGLESVVLSWKELDRLRVVSCNNIKDSEITAELATLFSVLKELKWQPDSRSMLSASLAGTGIGQKGSRSLRWK